MPLDKKDYVKIAVIAGIVIVPLIIGIYAVQMEDSNTRFWSEWDCDRLTEFAMSLEHQSITEQQHMMLHKDLEPCIEEP